MAGLPDGATGLLIDGTGGAEGVGGMAANGIVFLAGDQLTVEECYFTAFSKNAIDFEPNSGAHLFVKNTTITQAAVGVFFAPMSGVTATGTIHNSSVMGNTTGVQVQDGSRVNLFGTNVSENLGEGVLGKGLTGTGLVLMVDGCDVSNNGDTGIHADGSASIRVANTTIAGNTKFGVNVTNSSELISYQNNRLTQNGTNGSFTKVINPND